MIFLILQEKFIDVIVEEIMYYSSPNWHYLPKCLETDIFIVIFTTHVLDLASIITGILKILYLFHSPN